jgi:NAD(P)-dependent dehydrogenase (short-subunit alcohol dehydrogenase family)
VITSSVAGLIPIPNCGHYVAAKTGVVGLTRTFALELAPQFIRVNCICPTQVDTDMIHNEVMYRLFSPAEPNPSAETFAPISQSMNALPIPWVDSSDISNALVFLASDQARYITGVALPVDAGAAIISRAM